MSYLRVAMLRIAMLVVMYYAAYFKMVEKNRRDELNKLTVNLPIFSE